MHTSEQNNVDKILGEVDSVMTNETIVQDAVMTAMKILVIPRVELAIESVIAFSGRNAFGVVLHLDQSEFSKIIEGF